MRYLLILWLIVSWHNSAGAQDKRWLDAAAACARYLEERSAADPAGRTLVWATSERAEDRPAFNLYAGMPGGVLLLGQLERLRAPVGDELYGRSLAALLNRVRADGGLDSGVRRGARAGLYTGDAGILWLLVELRGLPRTPRVDKEIANVVRGLKRRMKKTEGGGGHWGSGTDIISGAAGTGLALLHAHEKLKTEGALDLAVAAGRWLITQGTPDGDGMKWKMMPNSRRIYPNFSHGTSGVGYFLARLHQATEDEAFLAAARRAAMSLEARMIRSKTGFTWYHHEGDGEKLLYVSWCHGPPGTARLFELLHRITGEKRYRKTVLGGASWLLASGVPAPAREINGYWNDSVCCGDAGIGEFYCDMYVTTKDERWLDAAVKIAEHLRATAHVGPRGELSWMQAEHRVRPKDRKRQTGWAQGSAGIGLFFLRLHLLVNGSREAQWRYADSPFPLS